MLPQMELPFTHEESSRYTLSISMLHTHSEEELNMWCIHTAKVTNYIYILKKVVSSQPVCSL